MTTYPFNHFRVDIIDPAGSSFLLGTNAKETIITEEPSRSSRRIGADGSVMTSFTPDKSGTATVRLLNTSHVNSLPGALYDQQTRDSMQHGRNTITISDTENNVLIRCSGAAFVNPPIRDHVFSRWRFHMAIIDRCTPT